MAFQPAGGLRRQLWDSTVTKTSGHSTWGHMAIAEHTRESHRAECCMKVSVPQKGGRGALPHLPLCTPMFDLVFNDDVIRTSLSVVTKGHSQHLGCGDYKNAGDWRPNWSALRVIANDF